MNLKRSLSLGACALALSTASVFATGADAFTKIHHPLGPLKQLAVPEKPYQGGRTSGTWTDLKHAFPGTTTGPDTALLQTDGTVLMHEWCTSKWFRLTPDNKGNYANGTWTNAGSLPSGYFPFFFASEILPDGRMIINGGEYNSSDGNCGGGAWTNKGALYDNTSDTWVAVSPPAGWSQMGDGQSVVLPKLSYMMANAVTSQEAIASISGNTVTWTATGTGKGDRNDEEGWTLLPNGKILTVDANRGLTGAFSFTEIYDPSTGAWTAGPNTTQQMVDAGSHELGPAVLRPDGTVVQFGGTPNNNVYDSASNTWSTAPAFPISGYDVADGPAVLLPSGNVLVEASPGVFNPPAHFFEFDGTSFTQVTDPTDAPNDTSFEGRFLMLPNGTVLYSNDGQSPTLPVVSVYTPQGSPDKTWLPKIRSVATTLTRGSTNNAISGKRFNGFSLGASYGDDVQQHTNYPIVMITNNSTGDVCFGRTHDFSTMGVFNTKTMRAKFDVPASCEAGASKLRVSVNGIQSKPTAVTLN